jgi:hypothetical protein
MQHPTREELDRLGPARLEAVAETVLRGLPLGWSIRACEAGTATAAARILFSLGEARFAYLPGGPCRIGFDVENWHPSDFEQESWTSSAEEWGLDGTIRDHLARTTRRPAIVELPPLLVETNAQLRGFEWLSPQSEEAKSILDRTAPNVVEATHDDTIYRFETRADGSRAVQRKAPMSHAALCKEIARDGMRLPTEEEWESFCAAGPTLFPWGDHAPCDHYPIEKPPSADDLDRDQDFPAGWAAHRHPNRWGIQPPHDPYKCERIAKPDVVRGGDGGTTICGGAGYFLGWLPLAPAWFEKELCGSVVEGGWDEVDGLSRRVLAVD